MKPALKPWVSNKLPVLKILFEKTYFWKNLFAKYSLKDLHSAAYDHDFWYIFVNWWYLVAFLKFFQNFDFQGC